MLLSLYYYCIATEIETKIEKIEASPCKSQFRARLVLLQNFPSSQAQTPHGQHFESSGISISRGWLVLGARGRALWCHSNPWPAPGSFPCVGNAAGAPLGISRLAAIRQARRLFFFFLFSFFLFFLFFLFSPPFFYFKLLLLIKQTPFGKRLKAPKRNSA